MHLHVNQTWEGTCSLYRYRFEIEFIRCYNYKQLMKIEKNLAHDMRGGPMDI